MKDFLKAKDASTLTESKWPRISNDELQKRIEEKLDKCLIIDEYLDSDQRTMLINAGYLVRQGKVHPEYGYNVRVIEW